MKQSSLMLVFCLLLLAGLAQAQDAPTLVSLEVSVWPEFDKPGVLVIYRGRFAEDTPLPVPVEIRIPASAGQPTAVAYVDEAGQRLNQQHATRLDGDWLVVSFDLTTSGFQLEYYDALAVDAEGRRVYTLNFVADYASTGLSLEFQVPPTARGFTLEPAADSVQQEVDSLTYHIVQAGSLAEGEARSWTLTYQKDNSDLTVSAFAQPQAQTPAPVSAPAGGEDNSTMLIFLVAFVALIAVGATAFWLGSRTQPDRSDPPPKPQKRRGSGRGSRRLARPGRDEAFFCHKCGAQLRSDSDFCHKCGAAVRRV